MSPLDIAAVCGAACGFVALGMQLHKWIWRKHIAELERKAQGYWHLQEQLKTIERWMDGEAANTAQWLREGDYNYTRKLGEPPVLGLPETIDRFRDFIRAQRFR